MEKNLKIVLCILAIILITVIAYAGFYSGSENILPEYLLGSEFTGKRATYYTLSEETEEKIYDKDGNEVDELPEGANEEDYRKETVKVNLDENITEENFKKVKEIYEDRLSDLGVEDYNIRLNNETGEIVVELPDDLDTDTFLQYLLLKGSFAMVDTNSKEVLISGADIKNASVVYANTAASEVTVYLDLKFTSEGAKKLEEVSRNYLKVEETDNEESEEEHKHEEQKTVSMIIDGTTLRTTFFGEVMTGGELTIAMGSGKDNETVLTYANQTAIFTMLINNGELPLTYYIDITEHVPGIVGINTLYIIIGVLAVITLILVVYMIIRFKVDGLFTGASFISALAILSLLLRYTRVTISLGALVAIAVLIFIEAYFILNILNRIKKNGSIDSVKSVTLITYLEKIDVIIALLIIAVVFTFMQEVKIFSVGMTLFYGIISLIVANLVFMRIMLTSNHE